MSPQAGQLFSVEVINKHGGRSRTDVKIRKAKKDGFSFNGVFVYNIFRGPIVHCFCRKIWVSSKWFGWFASKKLIFCESARLIIFNFFHSRRCPLLRHQYAQYISDAYFRKLSPMISKKIFHENNFDFYNTLTFEKYMYFHQVGHLIKSAFKKCIPAPVTRLIGNVTTYLLFTRYMCRCYICIFFSYITNIISLHVTHCPLCPLARRAVTKVLHCCLSLASCWMVFQLWFKPSIKLTCTSTLF